MRKVAVLATAVILGDIGQNFSWLMTPYEYPVTHEEKAYHKWHAKEKVIAERFVDQLKKRFSILQNLIRVALDKVSSILIACATLHNFAKYLNDYLPWDDTEIVLKSGNYNAVLFEKENAAARKTTTQKEIKRFKSVISNMETELSKAYLFCKEIKTIISKCSEQIYLSCV